MENIIKPVTAKALSVSENQVEIAYRLMGGMSNFMYAIEVNQEKLTFRIPGKNADVFVDRAEELANIKIIDELNINNETIFFQVETGYKIAKLVEGTPLSEMESPKQYLAEVANVLNVLHRSGLKAVKDYGPYRRLEKYEKLNSNHEEKYFDLKADFLSYQEFLDQFEKVICHNDSQISNMVIAQDKTYLLDWEFTGQNDPLYDVACVGNHDFQLAIEFLPIYLGREPLANEWKRLYLWRAFQCLQWHNVALYKDLIGLSKDLKLDFMKIAQAYLEKAEMFLTEAKKY